MRMPLRVCLILASILLLAACQSLERTVQPRVVSCCAETEGRSFLVVADRLPGFLERLMTFNVTTALLNRGYYPVEEHPDLLVVLTYEQDNLPPLTPPDRNVETVSELGDVRFVARIRVSIRSIDGAEGALVFEGVVERTHVVSANNSMHVGRASYALFDAFTALFRVLPMPQ